LLKGSFGGLSLGSYRSRLDIIADILNVVKGNAKKTQIMYQANLSFKVLQRYLSDITGASLIEFEDAKNYYVLTDKGSDFLDAYQQYSRTSKHIGKQLDVMQNKRSKLEKLCSNDKGC
jgi:predicted transcriptional regulator